MKYAAKAGNFSLNIVQILSQHAQIISYVFLKIKKLKLTKWPNHFLRTVSEKAK
jgi:hypothetical protein